VTEPPESKNDKKTGDEKEKEKKNGNEKDEKDDEKKKGEDDAPKWYSVHGQATLVSQGNWKFRSPYIGPNSLLPLLNYRTTATMTLFLDVRPWEGTEWVINPEMAAGGGVSGTTGIAGFPNGEATRTGVPQPTPYFARFLWKRTIGLGGEVEKIEDDDNQIAGYRDVNRIVIRAGKMSATDGFDDNSYSHDPRTQFLNWALMYNGAWDYPANARGYTYGLTLDLNRKDWAVRYGVFGEPTVANGQDIDPRFVRAQGQVVEYEQRYAINEHVGKIRLLAFLNRAHMGSYREALELSPINPDVKLTRAYRSKYGFGLNWEQEITKDLGVFGRLGWDDGRTEAWAFTEIDRTASLGLLAKGKKWSRPDDEVGLAVVVNGLSGPHRDYLAAGGIGFIIGDGRLNYGLEQIIETYYNWQLKKGINVTFDFQGVNHPAYNRDRGPVALFALRAHFEY